MLAAGEAGGTLTLLHLLAIVFALVGEALALVFVYRILVRGGSAASNLLWIVVILAAPWLGLLLYYLLPRSIQLRKLRRIRRRGARAREARSDSSSLGVESDGLAALLAEDMGLCAGNRVRWLEGGEQFFAEAEGAIAAAQHRVHCVVYILRPDEAGLRFLGCLAAAARRGVTVRLLYDSFGSLGLKNAHLQVLRDAGGRTEAFLPLLWKRRPFTVNLRNHRKLLVVDDCRAFVGGRNIANEYRTDRVGRSRRWLDAMVSVEGPVVTLLQDVFVEDWCTATDQLIEDEKPPPPEPAGDEVLGIVCSGPDRARSSLWFAIVQAISDARHSIELSSPYLVPPPMLLFALQLAAARGVTVRIYTNGPKTESAILYFAQRHFYPRMLEAGIEIHETSEDYNHSKVLVADGRVVVVGSANMDLRSAHLNFEIALVAVDSPALAAEALATIERRRQGCRQVSRRSLPTNPIARGVDGFCGLLAPLL